MPATAEASGSFSGSSAESGPGTDDNGTPKCKPHAEDYSSHCPRPVVPEAPSAVMLPASAGAVLCVFYVVARRRGIRHPE